MPEDEQQAMLRRIRAALGRDAATATAEPPPPPAIDPALVRLGVADDDLPAMFTARAQAVGMRVHHVTTYDAAATVVELLQAHGAKRVAVAAGDLDATLGVSDGIRESGCTLAPPQHAGTGMDTQFDLDAGVTDVAAALAETGSLVCRSSPAHPRGLSLAPPVHIALVRHADLVPDLLDYTATLRGVAPWDLPSSISFITGPSKTADIEGVLITGMHGPGAVEIVLIA